MLFDPDLRGGWANDDTVLAAVADVDGVAWQIRLIVLQSGCYERAGQARR